MRPIFASILVLISPALVSAQPLPGPSLSAPSLSAPSGVAGISIHQLELERHHDQALEPRIVPDEATLRAAKLKSVVRIVYGYLPYWVSDLTTIRWSALSHVAWFSIEMDATGAITARHGWPDTATVDTAHAAGVRVDLTFTLFSGAGILALCSDPARRATAIGNMIDEMVAGNADGISIDFEGLSDGTRDVFTLFVAELRQELEARGLSDKQISIAAPSVNWAGADGVPEFDLNALLDHADVFFIMGYGYFWSGSSRAGPIGMLRLSQAWRPYQSRSMLRTLADYSADIPAYKRAQIVWGAPYYGREWITGTDQMGAPVIDHVSAVTYSAARADLAAGRTRLWDEGSQNPWYVWQENGSWHQVYYEDEQSLAAKYQLALDQDIGGVGMWALNYDAPYQELWDLLEAYFGQPPGTPAGSPGNPIVIDNVPYHDERDTLGSPSSYFNFYSCAADTPEYGREWVYQLDVCTDGTVSATVPQDPWVDPDVHILTAPDQDACIDRANLDLATAVAPGRYYLVVDTWVNDLVTTEGPYTLDVDFVPDPGQVGCAAEQVCQAGVCACVQPDQSACGDSCVDTTSDVAHCGACGNSCAADESCVNSACTVTGPTDPPIDPPMEDAGGCCDASDRENHDLPWSAWLLGVFVIAIVRTRGRGRRHSV